MKQELKPFQHIIDLLIKRDGWLQVPLFQKEVIKTNGKKTYTTYSFPQFLHLHTDSGQQGK
jgi:hypothetical protein